MRYLIFILQRLPSFHSAFHHWFASCAMLINLNKKAIRLLYFRGIKSLFILSRHPDVVKYQTEVWKDLVARFDSSEFMFPLFDAICSQKFLITLKPVSSLFHWLKVLLCPVLSYLYWQWRYFLFAHYLLHTLLILYFRSFDDNFSSFLQCVFWRCFWVRPLSRSLF